MILKKRGKGLKFLMSFLLLAGMAFHSCMDEGIIDAPTWHQVVEFGDNALVRDAKAMVDETHGELAMPDMFKTMGKVQTRSSGSAPQTLASGSFTFDWDAAQSFQEENGTVLIVPIKVKQNMAIWRFTVINNKRKAEQTPMHSVLYMKKFERTGNIMGRVMSYAPSRKYMKKQAKKKKRDDRMEWYNPDHTDYSGLLLISSLDGTLIHGYNYEEGDRQFMFRPNVHQHNHSHEAVPVTRTVAETDSCLRHDHTAENKLVSPKRTIFSMRMISSTSAISSYSFDDETYVQPGCVICGKDPYTCSCTPVIGDVCDDCGKLPKDCICICPICGNKECTCPCTFCFKSPCECNTENCLFCGQYPCICEYNTGGGGGSGNGTGSGTGTTPGTGGSSVGGGSTNSSSPTITGGTVEQRSTIQNIINTLHTTYKLDLNGIEIELMEKSNCTSSAKILSGYSGIGICPAFFQYNFYDQTAKLWHEVYHLRNDDRNWVERNGGETFVEIEPPTDIIEDITYLINIQTGFTQNDPEWNSIYQQYILVSDCFDPIFNQNEINAYKAETNEFPNVSDGYDHERDYELWLYEARKNYFYPD